MSHKSTGTSLVITNSERVRLRTSKLLPTHNPKTEDASVEYLKGLGQGYGQGPFSRVMDFGSPSPPETTASYVNNSNPVFPTPPTSPVCSPGKIHLTDPGPSPYTTQKARPLSQQCSASSPAAPAPAPPLCDRSSMIKLQSLTPYPSGADVHHHLLKGRRLLGLTLLLQRDLLTKLAWIGRRGCGGTRPVRP